MPKIKAPIEPIKVEPDTKEPPHGSIVMVHGLTGTGYQRFYSTGRWHAGTGDVMDWDDIAKHHNAYLIFIGED